MEFFRAAERICRLSDKEYATAYQELVEQHNQLARRSSELDATDTGRLLNVYDELKGLNISSRVERLDKGFWNYGIDYLIDRMIAADVLDKVERRESREAFLSGLVTTLEGIRSQTCRTHPPAGLPETEDTATSGEAERNTKEHKNGRKGRKPKYTDRDCKLASERFDHLQASGHDVRGSWEEVATIYSFTSGKAAEMAVRRWKRCQTDKQNK